jgi:hypothetical protein
LIDRVPHAGNGSTRREDADKSGRPFRPDAARS